MARRSWTSLIPKDDVKAAADSESIFATSPNSPSANTPTSLEAAATLPGAEALRDLMRERQGLESQMQTLAGGREAGGSTDPRFPVMTFGERLREIQDWESRRESVAFNRDDLSNPSRRFVQRLSDKRMPSPRDTVTDRTKAAANGLTNDLKDRGNTAFRRSTVGKRLNTVNEKTRLSRVQKGLRGISDTASEVLAPLRDLDKEISGLSSPGGAIDQKLANSDIPEADKAEIRTSLSKELSSGLGDEVRQSLDKVEKLTSIPGKWADRLETGYKARRELLQSPLDKIGPYAKSRDKRLSLTNGGSGNLIDLSQANRLRALAKRREEKFQEKRDQARRDRAQEKAAKRRRNRD